jgi:hypothetical protein
VLGGCRDFDTLGGGNTADTPEWAARWAAITAANLQAGVIPCSAQTDDGKTALVRAEHFRVLPLLVLRPMQPSGHTGADAACESSASTRAL